MNQLLHLSPAFAIPKHSWYFEAMATKAAESAKQYDAKNVVGQYDKIWGLK